MNTPLNTPAEMAAARQQIADTFNARIATLEAAIATDQGGYILAWPEYSLGVKFENGKPRVVSPDDATITTATETRVCFNGRNERAVVVLRKTAMEAAIANAKASLAHLDAVIAKQREA